VFIFIGAIVTSADLVLPLDAFIRALAINKDTPHSIFLGAGASISSGVPHAQSCIWQWKRSIFLSNHPDLATQFKELSLPSVQARIQGWLDTQPQLKPAAGEDEYGFYAQLCYPSQQNRRQFFQSLIAGTTPHVGYQLLGRLAEAAIVRAVWTTNFDGLTCRAATANCRSLVMIEVGLDSVHRLDRQPRSGELLHVALHGDYRYDALKNLPSELKEQEAKLSESFIEHAKTHSIIIAGYSGRDESIMKVLTEAVGCKGSGVIYWCGYEDPEPPRHVADLLLHAKKAGREAFYIPASGFDDLLCRMALHCLTGDLLTSAQQLSAELKESPHALSPAFRVDVADFHAVVKSNALPLTVPTEILQFDCKGFDSAGAFQRLYERVRDREVVATLFRRKVLALGTVDAVKDIFGDDIVGEVQRTPIDQKELSYEDGVIVSLLLMALVKAIALSRKLGTDGREIIWRKNFSRTETVGDSVCRVHDAALLFIRRYRDQQYLVVKPTIRCFLSDGSDPSDDVDKEIKRRVLGKQWNKPFNSALKDWCSTLCFVKPSTNYEFPPNCGSSFRFRLSNVPSFARIRRIDGGQPIRLPPERSRHFTGAGLQLPEPKLVFANRRGDGYVNDILPIRGIATHRPYDHSLTTQGIHTEIRLGIVAPKADLHTLAPFIESLHGHVQPNTKEEYLVDYPGFASAFDVTLDTSDRYWADCPEPDPSLSPQQASRILASNLINTITSLHASGSPSVVFIYVPKRWAAWNGYKTDGESFDLHDFVKAACVQRGIATQFLREETLAKLQRCEVMWWLALSSYAKAMRTPWVLSGLDPNTAFVGIGYGVDPNAERGEHIVLGCSHIYNANGVGLRYRLSKIENPIWRGRNPYMSFEDARRLGETVRQQFFEATQSLPGRVVLHKRTRFLDDEQRGLREGLKGVSQIDMLEITVEPALRYVASRWQNGALSEDGYPVARGTAIILENRRAILWVHGSAKALNPHRTYYQGSSRIPAPLMIRRHFGESDLQTVANEILGLSKMNCNSFDLYTKFPATIESSSAIARIGSLLQRFGTRSYDYRLFI
jgi:hypothetical protein